MADKHVTSPDNPLTVSGQFLIFLRIKGLKLEKMTEEEKRETRDRFYSTWEQCMRFQEYEIAAVALESDPKTARTVLRLMMQELARHWTSRLRNYQAENSYKNQQRAKKRTTNKQ